MEKKVTKKAKATKASMPKMPMMSKMSEPSCNCMPMCHCHRGRRFFRFLLLVLLIVLIVGAFGHEGRWERGERNAMTYSERDGIFGVVSAIDGNNITIWDNAGEEETFQSTAKTMIYNSTMPIGLGALAVGDNVMISGREDDGVNMARTIRVVEEEEEPVVETK